MGVCYRCEEQSHGNACERPVKCPNCSGNHPSTSHECFYFSLEKETLTIQIREKLPYPRAKRLATEKLIRSTSTYASIATEDLNRIVNSSKTSKKPSNPRTNPNPGVLLSENTAVATKQRTILARRDIRVPDMETDDEVPSTLPALTEETPSQPQRNISPNARKRRPYEGYQKSKDKSQKNFNTPNLMIGIDISCKETKETSESEQLKRKTDEHKKIERSNNNLVSAVRRDTLSSTTHSQNATISTIVTTRNTTTRERSITKEDRKRMSSSHSGEDGGLGPPVKRQQNNKSPPGSQSSNSTNSRQSRNDWG